jgi:hypothetical protein
VGRRETSVIKSTFALDSVHNQGLMIRAALARI